jgi:hypothetical protein
MEDVGIFFGPLVYFTAIWYTYGHVVDLLLILCISYVLVSCTKNNLATLSEWWEWESSYFFRYVWNETKSVFSIFLFSCQFD